MSQDSNQSPLFTSPSTAFVLGSTFYLTSHISTFLNKKH